MDREPEQQVDSITTMDDFYEMQDKLYAKLLDQQHQCIVIHPSMYEDIINYKPPTFWKRQRDSLKFIIYRITSAWDVLLHGIDDDDLNGIDDYD